MPPIPKSEIYAITCLATAGWRISHQNPADIRNRSSFSRELSEIALNIGD